MIGHLGDTEYGVVLGVDLQDFLVLWISLTGKHVVVRTLEPCLPVKQQGLRNLLPFGFQERLTVKNSHPHMILIFLIVLFC